MPQIAHGLDETLCVGSHTVRDQRLIFARARSLSGCMRAKRRGLGVGHEHFGDLVAAVAAAMRNPAHEELSISAAWVLQGVAKRLAEASPAVHTLPLCRAAAPFSPPHVAACSWECLRQDASILPEPQASGRGCNETVL